MPVEITLIDRQNHHCFQPLLYQVATAALSATEIAWPIRSILSKQKNARVVMGEVVGVDRARRVVETEMGQSYPFDYLILASGATHSYFGHEDWAPLAPGLKRIEDAIEIRRRILLAFERAEIEQDPREQARLLTFVVVGGGPTGVEMAGSIAEAARLALARDFRRIDTRSSNIILLEAGPRLLPSFPEDLAAYARDSLTKMGVQVRTSTPVVECTDQGVRTSAGDIGAASVIWAAGVKASPAAEWVGAARDRAGRVIVNADLSIPGEPNIFAVGDTAHVNNAGQNIPGIAPAAKQMGRYVGKLIAARVKQKPAPDAFNYRHYGELATVGRKSAIVSLGKLRLTGFLGWMFWSVAHIYYLIGARHRTVVALDWIWNYLTYERGARLINECLPARMVLRKESADRQALSAR
jgi:NADH dehydrogenase